MRTDIVLYVCNVKLIIVKANIQHIWLIQNSKIVQEEAAMEVKHRICVDRCSSVHSGIESVPKVI